MFGFWVNLLDEGGYVGEVPRRRKVDYNQLWPVFKRAFRVEGRKRGKYAPGAQHLLVIPYTNQVSHANGPTRYARQLTICATELHIMSLS